MAAANPEISLNSLRSDAYQAFMSKCREFMLTLVFHDLSIVLNEISEEVNFQKREQRLVTRILEPEYSFYTNRKNKISFRVNSIDFDKHLVYPSTKYLN